MCFSKYFNNYLTRNNISINKLSKATGIDRATLHRYQNGDRLPKNIETVEAIADGLYMNAAERAEFLKEYDKATLGDDIVNSYHFFKNLLQNFSDTKDSVTMSIVSESIRIPETFSATEDTAALYHSHNIIAYVVRMFKQSHDSNGHIMLYMQPTYTQIQELLIPFFSGTDVIIEQLICFEKSIEKYHTNINVLKEVLPQAFTLKNYNVYYYYNNIVNNLNSVSPLPNLMINESCALMFDYEMQSGFFTTNKIIVNYLTEYFNRTKANFFSLIEKGSYIDNLDQLNSAINGRKIVTIFNQPCLGPCLDSKTLKESICQFPLKEQLIKELFRQYGDWRGTTHVFEEYNITNLDSCFTKNGLRSFAEKGKVDEFPEQCHQAFSIESRIYVLKRMLIVNEKKRCTYKMFRNDIELPKNIQIYLDHDNRNVWLRRIDKANLTQIGIQEASVYNTFMNVIKYIELKNLACTDDEFRSFIEELISELRKSNGEQQ